MRSDILGRIVGIMILIILFCMAFSIAKAETFPLKGNAEMVKPLVTKGYIKNVGMVLGQDQDGDGHPDVFWLLRKKCNIMTGCDLYVTRLERTTHATD